MKNLVSLLSLLTLFFIGSCNKEYPAVTIGEEQINNSRYNVNYVSALRLYNIMHNGNSGKEISTKSQNITPVIIKEGNDTLFYIINNPNAGWYIISGDTRTPEILATSEVGTFIIDDLNPKILFWLNNLKDYLIDLKQAEKPSYDNSSLNPIWSSIGDKYVTTKNQPIGDGFYQLIYTKLTSQINNVYGPFINTKWGQLYPWNQYIPYSTNQTGRVHVGCTAIAAAQILYYYNDKWNNVLEAPLCGVCNGDINNYNMTFSNFSNSAWQNMSIISQDSGSDVLTSLFLAYVAKEVQTQFQNDKSSSTLKKLKGFLSRLDIGYSFSSYNYNTVISEILQGNPVLVSGTNGDTKGHMWVIDGYKYNNYNFRNFYKWRLYSDFDENGNDMGDNDLNFDDNGNPIDYDYIDTYESGSHYFIMNWGWGGSYDDASYSVYGNWQPKPNGTVYNSDLDIFYNFSK